MTWPLVSLADVAEVRLGRQRAPKNHSGDSMRPYIRAANVTWAGLDLSDVKTMNFTDSEMATYRMEPGDIVLSEASGSPGEVGKPALWSGEIADCAFQNTLIRVRSREHDPKFLVHYFRYLARDGQFVAYSRGVGIHHIGRARLASWPVPLPPLADQRRIVELLEGHLSSLDAAESYLTASRGRLAALERSALDAHFGGTDVPLSDLIDHISAGKSFGGANTPAPDDEWGIIKVSAMTWGEFDPAENKAVAAKERVDPRFEIREGDLLVSRANTSEYVGASVLVRSVRPQLLLSDKSLRVTPRPGVESEWLWRALQAPSARRQISALATGTKDSMRNISQAALKRVLLPDVSNDEQVAALKSFNEVADAIAPLRREVETGAQRLKALRRSLLGAAFSGRLTGAPLEPSAAKEMINA